MPSNSFNRMRGLPLIVALMCGEVFLLLHGFSEGADDGLNTVRPQPTKGDPADINKRSGTGRTFVGVNDSCRICHLKPTQNDAIPGLGGTVDDSWVLLNEVEIWGRYDKHYQAFAVLLNDQSQRMAKILKIVDENKKSQIHRDQRCLACHSAMPLAQMEAVNGLVPVKLTTDPRLDLGVSCEGCHAPAGDGINGLPGWEDIHRSKTKWRFMSADQKQRKYGFYDVRSTVSKIRMCLSCHLGNAKEGKVVTHEMYAAGHPPLPGFEIETFIDQEPRHWRPFGEKSKAIRNEFLKETNRKFSPQNLHRTKSLIIGALLNLSESLKLVADLCANEASPVVKIDWPELAQFACFACHHELQSPAWRQRRKLNGFPGRPMLHEWPTALVQLALLIADVPETELDRQMREVRDATNQRPFGNPHMLQTSTRKVAKWADDLAEKLEQRNLTHAHGVMIENEICKLAMTKTLDYDSARQLVWAFQIVYSERKSKGSKKQSGRQPGWYDIKKPGEFVGWYENRKGLDAIERKLASLESMFLLDLRKGRTTSQELRGEDRPVLEVDLKLSLPMTASYEPSAFKTQFKQIADLLQRNQPGLFK